MTYIPGISGAIPANAIYPQAPTQSAQTLLESDWPMIYTTTGPLPIANGLAVTEDSLVWDASYVQTGDLDCGLYGSQA
jgi:hypothetical protein